MARVPMAPASALRVSFFTDGMIATPRVDIGPRCAEGRHMTPHTAIAALPASFNGDLIQPGDERYDDARAVWNGMYDRRPAVVARCTSTGDVVAALTAARSAGMPIAVRGGGHSASGFSTVDDGMVIDLGPMKAITVDAEAMTCRAQAGMTWGEFDAATQEHGL